MKLRNKNTGDRGELVEFNDGFRVKTEHGYCIGIYDTLEALNKDWEDYKPSEVWYITSNGELESASADNSWVMEKVIGNYFESKKDAEDAVEKLEALKSLKDKGFEFEGWHCPEPFGGKIDFTWNITIPLAEIEDDLNIIFGE